MPSRSILRRHAVLGSMVLGVVVSGFVSQASVSQAAVANGAVAVLPAALGISVSPQPGTWTANPDSQISFLGVGASSIRNLVVQGTRSGRHAGRLASYAAQTGASFLPARVGFQPGERVSVSANILHGASSQVIAFSFTVASPVAIPRNPLGAPPAAKAGQVQSFQSRPDLQPPTLTVSTSSPTAAPGDIFLAPIAGPGGHGPEIVDAKGNLVYFHPTGNDASMDFKVQQYQGRSVITWWQGFISNLGIGFGIHRILDSSYHQIAAVQAGNGYLADLHDFHILPNGAALLTAYAPDHRNLAFAHGSSNGEILDSVVQELDIKTGLVMFEWHAMDRVSVSESYIPAPRTTIPYDFFHVNSVQLDQGGSLLISARNTWAAYEVSPLTGVIQWRLGGRRSSFKMGPGTQFSWQHDIRRQADGTISVFDDGAAPKVESQSRGEVLTLDTASHSATVARQFTHPQPLLAFSQGSVQILPNGNTFVGWGQVNYLSEFSPSGQLVFDAFLPAPGESYRAFRYPWTGTPPHAPNVKLTGAGSGKLTAYTSWNGDTRTTAWRVLAGSSADPAHMTQVALAPRSGFETPIATATHAAYISVQALDSAGRVLSATPAISTTTTSELGSVPSGTARAPSCPVSPCLAVSRTTGYQAQTSGLRGPLVVPSDGRITAWTITLGAPNASEISYFDSREGGPAEAAIAVLRGGASLHYTLVFQAPLQQLQTDFGRTTRFVLSTPLVVKKGDVIALTVPTWAPALSVGYANDTSWRASRPLSACSDTTSQTAQTTPGSSVQYRCLYQTARLTYNATLTNNSGR